MVISIRRSRPDEGDKLIAIWCRSVDATHDFLSKAYRKELEEMVRAFLPEAPLWVAANTQTSRSPLCCLPESIWMRCSSIRMSAAAAWGNC